MSTPSTHRRDFSAAIWRPDLCLAEVVLQKGKVLGHLGFIQGSKLYLFPEEVAYLADRASLMLFIEIGSRGERELLSIQQIHDLLISSNIDEPSYQVFCKLLRAGYIVQRHPSKFWIKPSDNPRVIWHRWYAEPSEVVLKTTVCSGKTARIEEATVPKGVASVKRRKIDTTVSDKSKANHWWPVFAAQSKILNSLPRAQVYEDEASAVQSEFPNMAPLPLITVEELLSSDRNVDDGSAYLQFDVYAPDSNFSRKEHGPPGFILCTHRATNFPSPAVMTSAQRAAGSIPVRFASVENGDIAFFGFNHVDIAFIYSS